MALVDGETPWSLHPLQWHNGWVVVRHHHVMRGFGGEEGIRITPLENSFFIKITYSCRDKHVYTMTENMPPPPVIKIPDPHVLIPFIFFRVKLAVYTHCHCRWCGYNQSMVTYHKNISGRRPKLWQAVTQPLVTVNFWPVLFVSTWSKHLALLLTANNTQGVYCSSRTL